MRKWASMGVSLAILSFASQASAMTLNQAWQATKQHDPSYQSALLNVQASELGVKTQQSQLLPSMSVSAGQSWQKQWLQGASMTSHSNSYSIGLSQTLWNSSLWDQLSAAQSQLVSSELARSQSNNQLAENLFSAYMAVGQAKSNLALAKQQYQQGQKLLAITQHQYDAGQIMSTSLTAMKANVISEKTQILSAQSSVIAAETQLASMVGQATPNVVGLSVSPLKTPPALPQTHIAAWWRWAKDHSPALLNAEQQVKTAKIQLKGARSSYLPTVNGSVSYGGSFQSNTSRGLNAGVNVSLPLDLNGAIDLRVDQAQLAVEQAQNQARSVALALKQSVTNRVQQVALDWQRVEMAEKNVQAQEEALHSQTVIYKAGMGSAMDLINAHNNVFNSKNGLLNLVYQYWGDRVSLLAATGQLTDAKMAQLSKVLSV